MSMDNNWLYVTSSGNSTLNVIDLNQGLVTQTVALTSAPQGVEVGADGRALISMVGTGVVSGVPQGTLAVYDPTQAAGRKSSTSTSRRFPLLRLPCRRPR